MKLTRVTISGADDSVDTKAFGELSREFPFVEWGILYSTSRSGTARYPSKEWRMAFGLLRVHSALHLCGGTARDALAGDTYVPDGLHHQRFQLNGFSEYRLPYLRFARELRSRDIILQCQDDDALDHAVELAAIDPNISALWDRSGGTGEEIRLFPREDRIPMGYAGGLGPDNLLERLAHISEKTHAAWIDMESGVRTDDRFDLSKVRRVLELAAPFIDQ